MASAGREKGSSLHAQGSSLGALVGAQTVGGQGTQASAVGLSVVGLSVQSSREAP